MQQALAKFGLLTLSMVTVGTLAFAQPKILPFTFTATLSGDQLTTPVETDGTGTVIAVLLGNQLTVTGTYQDLSSPVNTTAPGGANIRMAPPGEDGSGVRLEAEQPFYGSGRVMGLKADGGRSGTFSGVFALTDEQLAALGDGLFYVQLYTRSNLMGELRAQLVPGNFYNAYREYLAALDDPDVVHDATETDLVGMWRDTATGALWQLHENGTWTRQTGTGSSSTWWEFEDNAFSIGWSTGTQVELTVLYEDGRRRYLVIQGQGSGSEPVGSWHERVLIDEEGNRVNLR